MVRPFRFTAPTLRPTLLARPRLLRLMGRRWEHRVTLVLGGAGLGKTTLLVQAMAENRLAPVGDDVWLELDEADGDAGHLADALLRALGGTRGADTSAVDAIADALWRRAPTQTCLVLDDVHAVPDGSTGHRLLTELTRLLPANGHLVLAARTDPHLPLARLATTGELQRVTETSLRFDSDELHLLAEQRGVEVGELADTGGWPAMAELTASAGRRLSGEYLWQEVIEPLGRDRRRILAALVELGGGDDALLSAALDERVDLAVALEGVPLVSADERGWYQPHALWRPMARLRLPDAERPGIVRRAVHHHAGRARFDDAFTMLAAAGLWDEAPAVIRASCFAVTRHPRADHLRRWLAASPPSVSSTAEGMLGEGVLAELEDPDNAVAPLRKAIAAFRDAGDLDAELGAIAHLGRAAWWTKDLAVLAELTRRTTELEGTGHPVAEGLAAVGRAVEADLAADDGGILDALASVAPGQLGPAWDPTVAWLRASDHFALGDLSAVLEISTPLLDLADPVFRVTIETMHWAAQWKQGRVDSYLDGAEARRRAVDATGVVHNMTLAALEHSRAYSHVGDIAQARALLERARRLGSGDRPVAMVRTVLADASVLVAEGDEDGAAARLREGIQFTGLGAGGTRRLWRDSLALTYVLVPETRRFWDDADLTGCWAHTWRLARAVVAFREGRDADLDTADVADVDLVRARLHHRFAAELAAALEQAGRSEGQALLERLGLPGRAVLRILAASSPGARSLLSKMPSPPPVPIEIGVLGPTRLRRDGDTVDEPALRRERVRALLALLVARRTVTRGEACAALWPDFDQRAASNNLRVTINHLLGALEPWRAEGEPSYVLRSDKQQLRLVTGDNVTIDIDLFDRHLATAERSERDTAPSVALEAYLAAIALWRGDLHADAPDADWLHLDRERARLRYLAALQRAAQLLVGRGDVDHADELARRALDIDPWAEAAHGVLIAAALARGDRNAAAQAYDRCAAALTELGVDPSPAIQQLARRLHADARADA